MQTTIKFYHYRQFEDVYDIDTKQRVPAPKGGATVAYLLNPQGAVLSYSIAWCSDKDNFSRKRGRQLASSRLTAGHGSPFGFAKVEDFRHVMDMRMADDRGYARR